MEENPHGPSACDQDEDTTTSPRVVLKEAEEEGRASRIMNFGGKGPVCTLRESRPAHSSRQREVESSVGDVGAPGGRGSMRCSLRGHGRHGARPSDGFLLGAGRRAVGDTAQLSAGS